MVRLGSQGQGHPVWIDGAESSEIVMKRDLKMMASFGGLWKGSANRRVVGTYRLRTAAAGGGRYTLRRPVRSIEARFPGCRWRVVLPLLTAVLGFTGCRQDGEHKPPASDIVTVYCSVDEGFAREILDRYEASTGRRVQAVFDSEAGKTTGLVNRIIHEAESGRPRADVFWSGELFNTILLARRGLLEKYDPPTASDIPPRFRDPGRRWTALAVRGRVIAFRGESKAANTLPTKWEDLARPAFASQTAIANPLFGTTRGHVAAMFALWGGERGRAFLTGLRDGGAHIVDGNSTAVRKLIAGACALAATDTDDVWVAQKSEAKSPGGVAIDLRYLDMGDGGTLLIPCSVAVVVGGPAPAGARQLVDYLVSAEVERALAQSGSRNVPVRKSLREELGMDWPAETKVTFDAIADAMEEAVAASREILLR